MKTRKSKKSVAPGSQQRVVRARLCEAIRRAEWALCALEEAYNEVDESLKRETRSIREAYAQRRYALLVLEAKESERPNEKGQR